MAFIRAYPGLHLSEIARRLRWSVALAEYHLRVLERHSLVSTTRLGQRRAYFAVAPGAASAAPHLPARPAVAAPQRATLALLRHPVRLHMVTLLAARPGAQNRDIALAIGLSRPATSHHLGRLLRAGVVTRGDGGGYGLARAAEIVPLLRAQRPFEDQVDRFRGLWDDLVA